MPPPNHLTSGWTAHLLGRPMSACPYELNTAAGRLWRRGWIQAEQRHREHAGRMGESSERWEEARRMVVAEYPPDPCQEVSDNLEELEHPPTAVGKGGSAADARIVASQVFFRRADDPAARWQNLGPVRDAQITIRRDDDQIAAMKMAWAALAENARKLNQVAITMNFATKEAAAAIAALGRALKRRPGAPCTAAQPEPARGGETPDALPVPRRRASRRRLP